MLYLAPAKQSIRLYDMRAVFQRRVIRILKHAPTDKEAEIYGSNTRPHDQGGNNKLLRKHGIRVKKRPEQASREEAVVKALVGSHGLGLLSELGREPEGLASARSAPEEHLQYENVAVDGADKAGGCKSDDAHFGVRDDDLG
ncbi:hypothetical protein HG530_002606 [Fusarium avenaceum]|nr:hypothetical protein HG530_002606 [Fusarium avenaceum]